MTIPMALDYSFNFIQQAAGLANIFDTYALFPEIPKVAELMNAAFLDIGSH